MSSEHAVDAMLCDRSSEVVPQVCRCASSTDTRGPIRLVELAFRSFQGLEPPLILGFETQQLVGIGA